jgi:hypothetical protein
MGLLDYQRWTELMVAMVAFGMAGSAFLALPELRNKFA